MTRRHGPSTWLSYISHSPFYGGVVKRRNRLCEEVQESPVSQENLDLVREKLRGKQRTIGDSGPKTGA